MLHLRTAKILILLLAVIPPATVFAQAKPYRYFRVGNPADVKTRTEAGFALIGGGKDLDPAFLWMCHRSGGGDFLILRATGTDAYNPLRPVALPSEFCFNLGDSGQARRQRSLRCTNHRSRGSYIHLRRGSGKLHQFFGQAVGCKMS
jgi:hypothetical protein